MNNPQFTPDFRNLLAVVQNRRPRRLPLYEHHIDLPFIQKLTRSEISLTGRGKQDYEEYYRRIVGFWKDMTYDGFDYEASVCDVLPGHGAIFGGRPGPIQTRDDLRKYPFDELPGIFWETYEPHLEAIRAVLPGGMKAYGGCGYGIFEAAEDLVGYERLCLMQFDDPVLFRSLFTAIGDLYQKLWSTMVTRYGDIFVFFRLGDDLGFKTSTLLAPETLREHILPQYRRIIDIVHAAGKQLLLHSCGNIFSIMEDLITLGIDAKHSNEDQIAPFSRWLSLYSDRIGFLGGIDLSVLCTCSYQEVYRVVLHDAEEFRRLARGYGVGSGNSIPGYVPVDGFLAMIDAANELRRRESRAGG